MDNPIQKFKFFHKCCSPFFTFNETENALRVYLKQAFKLHVNDESFRGSQEHIKMKKQFIEKYDKKAIENSDLTNIADLNEFLEFENKFETELANEIKLDLNSSFIESNENNDGKLLLEWEKEKFLFNQEKSQLNDLSSRVKEIEKRLAAEKTKLEAQYSHIEHLKKTEKYENTKLKSLIQIHTEKYQDYRILLNTKDSISNIKKSYAEIINKLPFLLWECKEHTVNVKSNQRASVKIKSQKKI